MLKYLLFIPILTMLSGCLATSKQTSAFSLANHPASNLLVEDQSTPLNIHNQTPRLSWHANVKQQAAYQIQVASTASLLSENRPDLWDSGKVNDRKSLNVLYQGKQLSANQQLFWRVRVWPKGQSNANKWSNISQWEMGLLTQADWQADWLQIAEPKVAKQTAAVDNWIKLVGTVETEQGDIAKPAINKLQAQPTASLFRHEFAIGKTIKTAKLHSTAAGYYEIYINGQRIGDRLMDPGQTDYDKRILYNTDKVGSLLSQGQNTIAVHLASGWYDENIAFSLWNNPDKKESAKKKKSLSYGQPKFIAQLDVWFTDGTKTTISSNNKWLSKPSHILKEGIFSGEIFDAKQMQPNWNRQLSKETGSANQLQTWQPAQALKQWPTEKLEPQRLPPIRKQQTLKPVALFNPEPGVWVYDFGQNFTGLPKLNIGGLDLADQQTVFLRYAEWADKKGNISQLSGGSWATHLNAVDAYIASNEQQAAVWEPSFTWRGFRYIEITGLNKAPKLTDLSARLLRSDVTRVGEFSSSDPLVNKIHQTALWSYESNLMSVPLDCPNREKAGWTGDAHAALITGNYNYDMETFWRKYLGDFKTASFTAPIVVPGKRTAGGKVDWAAAEVFIAWENYRTYGDSQILSEQYQSLLEYMEYGQSQLTDYLTANGFGDWCDPVPAPGMPRVGGRGVSQQTSTLVTSSALFARSANLMAKIANVLDKSADEKRFTNLFNNIRQSFHQNLYNPKTGHYGSQTADAMAIRFDLTPEHLKQSVADALNKDIIENWHGHSSVGALGQTWLYRALSDYGYADTAFNIFKAKGYPGFEYLFDELDGTTLWERKGQFEPNKDKAPIRSLNHPFHSGYDGWFYEGLGGIRALDDSIGFQDFELAPVFPSQLNQAQVSYKTGYGVISSRWKRENEQIIWHFTVPDNSTAMVRLPNQKATQYFAGEHSIVIESATAKQVAKPQTETQLAIAPYQLRVELLKGAEVEHINDLQPEFSWQLANQAEFAKQTAYQIQVIKAEQSFETGLAEQDFVWDSGKKASQNSAAISLFGKKLSQGQAYQWRVRVWTQASEQNQSYISAWSAPQRFIMSEQANKLASRYDLQLEKVAPVLIKKLPSGRYFIDFGKVGFGYLSLGLTSNKAGSVKVHFAERGHASGPKQGVISELAKASSVRYYQVPLDVNAKSDVYAVHPPRDQRNTKSGKAVAIPAEFGRIAPFRFIEIDPQGLELTDIKASLMMLHYPFEQTQSYFNSSNSILNEVWQLCKYSMKATSFAGVYVDGDRERIPYEADAYINQLSHYYVDDEFSLARHSHEYLMKHPTWPTEWKQHSIMMAWTDWMYTGDTESLAAHYQQLKDEKTLEQYEAEHGLLSTFPKRIPAKQLGDLVDWPPNERDNYDMRPVNTVVNAFYYLNLKQMAEMAQALQLTQDYHYYSAKAERVAKVFNQKLYNPETGLYRDGIGTDHSAIHANILPLAFGLVEPDKREKVLEFVKHKGMAVSVYFAQYLMEALYLQGEADYALSLLTSTQTRSWYNMIAKGSTITMEAWDDKFKPNQDWNHAWGAVPGNIVGRFILGVRPQTTGFSTITVAPQPASLTQVSGKVPTIKGPVVVDIAQTIGETFSLKLSIPGNTQAQVILPLKASQSVKSVTLDNENISYQRTEKGVELTLLGAGEHNIKMHYH